MTCGEKFNILPIFWWVWRFISNTLELFFGKIFYYHFSTFMNNAFSFVFICFTQNCANIVKPCDFSLKRLLLSKLKKRFTPYQSENRSWTQKKTLKTKKSEISLKFFPDWFGLFPSEHFCVHKDVVIKQRKLMFIFFLLFGLTFRLFDTPW